MFSEDLASAIVKIVRTPKKKILRITNNKFPIINVGSNESLSIKKLSELIKKLTGYKGQIYFDKNYPDGTFKKNLDSSKMRKLNWKPKVNLSSGLKAVINSRKSF